MLTLSETNGSQIKDTFSPQATEETRFSFRVRLINQNRQRCKQTKLNKAKQKSDLIQLKNYTRLKHKKRVNGSSSIRPD